MNKWIGKRALTAAISIGALGLLATAIVFARPQEADAQWKKQIAACAPSKSAPRAKPNEEARKAAQKGLDFLGRESVAWYQKTTATVATFTR